MINPNDFKVEIKRMTEEDQNDALLKIMMNELKKNNYPKVPWSDEPWYLWKKILDKNKKGM
jgi:hypothetical protein